MQQCLTVVTWGETDSWDMGTDNSHSPAVRAPGPVIHVELLN